MAAILVTVAFTSSLLAQDFEVNHLSCVDNGVHERYCPRQAYPYYNKKFAPTRADLRIKAGKLGPKARREDDDTIGLRFEYNVVCEEKNESNECTRGDVTIHVHPTPKWDRPIPWWQLVIDFVIGLAICMIVGPIAILFFIFADPTPGHKSSSRFEY